MSFYIQIFGHGFGFQIGGFDAMEARFVIFSWRIIRHYEVWRGETHSRGDGGYHYRCVKNGKTVEDISFRSPVVNHG